MATQLICRPAENTSDWYLLTSEERLAMGSLFIIIGTSAIICYFLVIAAIITTRRFSRSPGYQLIVSLSASEMIPLIVRIYLALPTSYLHHHSASYTYLTSIGIILYIGYNSIVPGMIIMSLNLYICLVHPSLYPHLFSKTKCRIYMASIWLFTVIFSIPFMVGSVNYCYEPELLSWGYVGDEQWVDAFIVVKLVTISVGILTSLCCYTTIIIRIRRMKQVVHHSGAPTSAVVAHQRRGNVTAVPDRTLTGQLLTVTVVFFVTAIFHALVAAGQNFHAYTTSQSFVKWMNFIFNLSWVFQYSVDGFVYLAFNRRMRTRVLQIICCHVRGEGADTTQARTVMNYARSKDRRVQGTKPASLTNHDNMQHQTYTGH